MGAIGFLASLAASLIGSNFLLVKPKPNPIFFVEGSDSVSSGDDFLFSPFRPMLKLILCLFPGSLTGSTDGFNRSSTEFSMGSAVEKTEEMNVKGTWRQ